MKPLSFLLFFSLFTSAVTAQKKSTQDAPAKPPQEYFLDMEGLVKVGQSRGKAVIKVFKDSTVFLTTESDKHFGKCRFKLPLGSIYVIEISRENYVTKKIKIDARVPDLKRKDFNFRFEVDIFEYIPKLNYDILKRPIAEIEYNVPGDVFLYDAEYTNKINKELKKLYYDYYMLQKAELEEK